MILVESFTRGSLYNNAACFKQNSREGRTNSREEREKKKKGSKGHEEAAPRQIPVT